MAKDSKAQGKDKPKINKKAKTAEVEMQTKVDLTNDKNQCGKCDSECTENSKSIQCEFCKVWFHQACTPLTPSEYKTLVSGNQCLLFACPGCTEDSSKVNRRFGILEDRVKTIENQALQIDGLKDLVKALQQQNELILKLLENQKEAKMEERKLEKQIERQIKDKVIEATENEDEQREKEEKKDNLIIFNIDETDEGQDQKELATVNEILKVVDPNFDTQLLDNSKISRLGAKRTPRDNQKPKPRPIRVTLPSQEDKMKILKKANALKGHSLYSKIGLSKDKTKKEMVLHQTLRKELMERRSKGEDVTIYKDNVVLRSAKTNQSKGNLTGQNRADTQGIN